eukprot:GDKI01046952.1.p1 GENE.GDKI01046952.1~~GDKI01046952.1.p1  ORF type:complete len:306 (-),score=71.21 GDKI01046952.1:230-1147(-)
MWRVCLGTHWQNENMCAFNICLGLGCELVHRSAKTHTHLQKFSLTRNHVVCEYIAEVRNTQTVQVVLAFGDVVAVCGVVQKVHGSIGDVWTLGPLSQEAVKANGWSCMERHALAFLEGAILVTDDISVMGQQAVQQVLSRPSPVIVATLPDYSDYAPSAPPQYYEPHRVQAPSYSVQVSVQMQAAQGYGAQPQYGLNPAYAQPPSPQAANNVHINIGQPMQQQNAYNQNASNPYSQNACNPYSAHHPQDANPYSPINQQQEYMQQPHMQQQLQYPYANQNAPQPNAPPPLFNPNTPHDNHYFQMK